MKVRDVFGENMDSPQEGDYFDIELTESELLGTYVESVMEDGSIILAADDKMLEMLEEMNMVEYTALPLDTMDDYTHRRKTLQDILRDPGMDPMTKKVAQQRLLQLDKEAKEKGFATEGAGHEDMVRFVLDTERAYQAVMDRFGDHIMWDDNDYMLVPVKFWGDLQRVAHDADGIGAEDVDGSMHEGTGLSPDLLARYKKLAGLDASKADKEGDTERANKRFSGIVRATKKEFDNDAKDVKQTNEAQRTREQVKAELAKINDKIEAIVKDGGRVPMNDPLTVKLKALQAELKKLKESIELVDENIGKMSHEKLRFHRNVPHGRYTNAEIQDEIKRRKKTGEYHDGYKAEDTDLDEAEYRGREVPLGKPMQGDVKKFKVYVKNPKGNVVKVNFGDPNMRIKKSNPARRKSFRARHNCANPGPRHKARYWSCRKW